MFVCLCLCVHRLQEILEVAEDMAIDIPHIWLYLAELITPMLHEGGIPMGQLFRWDQAIRNEEISRNYFRGLFLICELDL